MRISHIAAVLAVCAGFAWATQESSASARVFDYVTVRANDRSGRKVESVRLQWNEKENGADCSYVSLREAGSEFVSISLGESNRVLSARMSRMNSAGRTVAGARIIVRGNTVHSEQFRPDGRVRSRSRELDERPLVADAGLLFWLREFPFGTDGELSVMMAAFTGHFVTMRFRDEGPETVTVPAGSFECRRVVGVVDLVATEIKTTYWLTAAEPHFLVKFEGRRGIFIAPVYTTSLVSTNGVGVPGLD
ncbi:MAG: DUF3108 domain-containing protein [Lentisphaerae bacterium]|nr:DUF3108 domain-containing protein [Lentisphaerota bacterium]